MRSGIELSRLVLPEQEDLAWDVAELVCSEVCKIDFMPSMFSKYKKVIRDNTLIVAQDSNGLLLATGLVMAPKSKDASITDVATAQPYRDSGVGRMVVRELESVARSMGAERATLHPLPASKGFYERLGYENIGDGTGIMAKHLV